MPEYLTVGAFVADVVEGFDTLAPSWGIMLIGAIGLGFAWKLIRRLRTLF